VRDGGTAINYSKLGVLEGAEGKECGGERGKGEGRERGRERRTRGRMEGRGGGGDGERRVKGRGGERGLDRCCAGRRGLEYAVSVLALDVSQRMLQHADEKE